jgi:hypothetical protein
MRFRLQKRKASRRPPPRRNGGRLDCRRSKNQVGGDQFVVYASFPAPDIAGGGDDSRIDLPFALLDDAK